MNEIDIMTLAREVKNKYVRDQSNVEGVYVDSKYNTVVIVLDAVKVFRFLRKPLPKRVSVAVIDNRVVVFDSVYKVSEKSHSDLDYLVEISRVGTVYGGRMVGLYRIILQSTIIWRALLRGIGKETEAKKHFYYKIPITDISKLVAVHDKEKETVGIVLFLDYSKATEVEDVPKIKQ